jgi:hypothetical protein
LALSAADAGFAFLCGFAWALVLVGVAGRLFGRGE